MNLVSARTGRVSLRLGIILSLAGVPSLEASPIMYRVLDLGTLPGHLETAECYRRVRFKLRQLIEDTRAKSVGPESRFLWRRTGAQR
jgi:hypothetical protein